MSAAEAIEPWALRLKARRLTAALSEVPFSFGAYKRMHFANSLENHKTSHSESIV